ncbi:uncharacterized protein LOC117501589 [Thalassophryne amazonica]|uniref:uncharacterized protein LOC117501589 n=1 Tax=Thalassophryne amazonica TaxID=390379 RepID=UPI001471CD2B|nr:uncharacterized protein LOC117501589 [Thalassophryne amazonica]
MKTSKAAALQASAQEECGVWLDTVLLKGKAKQKQLARPISKLLNPLAEGAGYSLAVALNFTQTRVEMPKTKQSSISSFFSPQRREQDLNKMSTSEKPQVAAEHYASSSASTTCASAAPGTLKKKRKCDGDLEILQQQQHKTCSHYAGEGVQEHDKENTECDSKGDISEEINPPERKRRITRSSMQNDSHTLRQGSSQDVPFTWSKPCDRKLENDDLENTFYLTQQKYTMEEDLRDSQQSEAGFRAILDEEGRTSSQKALKQLFSSQVDDKNSHTLSSKSPKKHSLLSHVEPFSYQTWTEPKTASPRKYVPEQLWKKADRKENLGSQCKRTNRSLSKLRKQVPEQPGRDSDEDSLDMLFTQDSEGFRVIAHRSQHPRSPFKDQTNLTVGSVRCKSPFKICVEDDEDEILFTQDSQGNMVIKH